MNKEARTIFTTVLMLSLAGFFIWMFAGSVKRGEISECHGWAEQAKEYPGFYLTTWQRQQCEAHHIAVEQHNYARK